MKHIILTIALSTVLFAVSTTSSACREMRPKSDQYRGCGGSKIACAQFREALDLRNKAWCSKRFEEMARLGTSSEYAQWACVTFPKQQEAARVKRAEHAKLVEQARKNLEKKRQERIDKGIPPRVFNNPCSHLR